MGIMKGALSVRRYRVEGDLPPEFHQIAAEALEGHAFHEPASKTHKEEVIGWVQSQNLLDTDFQNRNNWLFSPYIIFSMRMDKKSVPGTLLRAHVDRKARAWAEAKGKEKCPAGVKRELREQIELEMLAKTLPRVRVVEVCWNYDAGIVLFHSHSEGANDTFRKLFHRSFGLELHAEHPAEWLDEVVATQLETSGNSDFSNEDGGSAPAPQGFDDSATGDSADEGGE